MKKFVLLTLSLILILSFSVTTFAQEEVELKDPWVTEKPQGEHGGTLMTSILGDPKTFNTIIAQETSSTDLLDSNIFETLVTANGVTTEIEPELAKDWEISEDGTVYTFYLREGVQWSDGEELTADDVIFTFDLINDEDIPTSTRDLMMVDGEFPEYKKIDKYTVEIEIPTAFAPFLNNMMSAFIVPKHKLYDAWQEGNFNNTWGINTEPSEIVGTGPFTIGEYKQGERVILLKNSRYWRKDTEGKSLPYLNRWVQVIIENTETRDLLFEQGQTHFNPVLGINYNRFEKNTDQGNYSMINAGPTFSTNFLVFNLNPDNPKIEEEPWKYEWFTNINFRRAIAYAMDKETMINQALAGFGEPQWSPVSAPNKVFLNEDVPKYKYNLEKAREELEKGGFSWNDDEQLIDEDGRIVEFTMITNTSSTTRVSLMNIIATELRNLGMKINSTSVEFNAMVNQLQTENNFDTIVIGLTGGIEPHDGSNVWSSSGQLHMWNPVQEEPATDWEARIDELFVKGATATSTEKRTKYYDEFQEIIAEKVPVIYTVTPNSLYAVRNTVKNTEVTAFGGITWNIHELYLDE